MNSSAERLRVYNAVWAWRRVLLGSASKRRASIQKGVWSLTQGDCDLQFANGVAWGDVQTPIKMRYSEATPEEIAEWERGCQVAKGG